MPITIEKTIKKNNKLLLKKSFESYGGILILIISDMKYTPQSTVV